MTRDRQIVETIEFILVLLFVLTLVGCASHSSESDLYKAVQQNYRR